MKMNTARSRAFIDFVEKPKRSSIDGDCLTTTIAKIGRPKTVFSLRSPRESVDMPDFDRYQQQSIYDEPPHSSTVTDGLDLETRPSFSRRLSRRNSNSTTSLTSIGGVDKSLIDKYVTTSTEQLMTKHNYKIQLSKVLKSVDYALSYFQTDNKDDYLQGVGIMLKLGEDVWCVQNIGVDLAQSVCDHVRRTGNLDLLVHIFVDNKLDIRTQVGELLVDCLSPANRDYMVQAGYIRDFLKAVIKYGSDEREHRKQIALALLEHFFEYGTDMCKNIMEWGGLELLLDSCKKDQSIETLLNVAIDMSNLALFGGIEIRQKMVDRCAANWLFVLANNDDVQLRYYTCLTACILASERSLEMKVAESGTLVFVENFIKQNRPDRVAKLDTKFRYGRSAKWLTALLPLLQSPKNEVQSIAVFQFAMETSLRKGLATIKVFEEINAIPALKDLAASPCKATVAELATEILQTLGEVVPYRLNQHVPLWSIEDVQFWVTQIGFGDIAYNFAKCRVDGDLLLRTTEQHLEEIGLTSLYEKMRFMRELKSLKCSADYSAMDPSELDPFLIQINKEFSAYTYNMLHMGVDRSAFIYLNDELLKSECGVTNGVHRMKLLNAVKDVKHVDDLDIAVLRKQVDIFICYRRSTGSQLASLLKVLLQLRGYKVFIDVDRLYAGQFDTSLLKNIRAAKHFILILTRHALDRCVDDFECKDWVHTEIRTALESGRNIVPVQERNFEWPDTRSLPTDIRPVVHFNAVHWVHEYQEACIEKLDKFLKGETDLTPDLQRMSSLNKSESFTGICCDSLSDTARSVQRRITD